MTKSSEGEARSLKKDKEPFYSGKLIIEREARPSRFGRMFPDIVDKDGKFKHNLGETKRSVMNETKTTEQASKEYRESIDNSIEYYNTMLEQRRRNDSNEMVFMTLALVVCGAVIWMLVRHLS